MISIICYTKYTDQQISREIRLPTDGDNLKVGTELATVDGVTYISIPEGVTLPYDQPSEIADSIRPVILTEELRNAIKSVSPHYKLINTRIVERIRSQYSADDEIKCMRLSPSPETDAWNAYVEECRAWGREEKAKLGL